MTNLTDEIRRQDLGYATLQYRGLWAERLEPKPGWSLVWLDYEDGRDPVDPLEIKSLVKIRHRFNALKIPHQYGSWLRSETGWFLSWVLVQEHILEDVLVKNIRPGGPEPRPEYGTAFEFPFKTFKQLEIVPA